MLTGIVQGCRVKLNELHVLHLPLGAIHHGDTVAGRDDGVGRCLVNLSGASGSDQRNAGEYGLDLARLGVQHISAIAGYTGHTATDFFTQVMLGDQVDREVMRVDLNVRMFANLLKQGPFDLVPGRVLEVEHPVFAMTTFPREVVVALRITIETCPPLDDLADPLGAFGDHHADHVLPAQSGTCDEGIPDVLFECIRRMHDTGDSSLGVFGVGFIGSRLGHNHDLALFRRFQGEGEPGNAGTQNEEIGFLAHNAVSGDKNTKCPGLPELSSSGKGSYLCIIMIAPKKVWTVYAESTPNPATMKFVASQFLLLEGHVEYTDPAQAANCPLARRLFEFSGVTGVFIMSNFVTITKREGIEWFEFMPILREFIKSYLESGDPVFTGPANQMADASIGRTTVGNELEDRIIATLDEYVKPAVEQDGGAIQFKSFEDGKVTVILQGACSGCPSSTMTLKSGIEQLLRTIIPEVKEVVAEAN